MKIDYGASYFDTLKKYVHLQKEFDAYKKQAKKEKTAIAFIAACTILYHILWSLFKLIFN